MKMLFSFSLPGGQRFGLPPPRDAGEELQEQRSHTGNLRPDEDIQAAGL